MTLNNSCKFKMATKLDNDLVAIFFDKSLVLSIFYAKFEGFWSVELFLCQIIRILGIYYDKETVDFMFFGDADARFVL